MTVRIVVAAAVMLVSMVLANVAPRSSSALPDNSRHEHANGSIIRAMEDARRGSPEASYIVGLACYYGDGVIQDYSEAAKYFKLAAQAGHGQAALNAGHMFDNAIGITRDANAAFSYFALAANGGNGEACLRAGAMLYSEAASLPPNADPEHNIKTAIHYLTAASEAHVAAAFFYLGNLHEYGAAYISPNFPIALDHYKRGCELGESDCCYHYALMVAYGRGTPQDYPRAALLFKQLFERVGHGGAAYFLGLLHVQGDGVPIDYDIGLFYLNEAVRSNDTRIAETARAAASQLGDRLHNAEDVRAARLATIQRTHGRSNSILDQLDGSKIS